MKYYDYYDFDDEINIVVKEYNRVKPDKKVLENDVKDLENKIRNLESKKAEEKNDIFKRKYDRIISEYSSEKELKEKSIEEIKAHLKVKIDNANNKLEKKLKEKASKIEISEQNIKSVSGQLEIVKKQIEEIKSKEDEELSPAIKESTLLGLYPKQTQYENSLKEYMINSEILLEEKLVIEELKAHLNIDFMEKLVRKWNEITKESVMIQQTTPTTPAPTTQAPTTPAPTTPAPTTPAPTAPAPTTPAPTAPAPTTPAPTTPAPTTQAPTTQAPTTQAPTTPDFIKKMKGITIGKEGVVIGDEIIHGFDEVKEEYEYCKKNDDLDEKKLIIEDIMEIESDGINIAQEVAKNMDPNILEAIRVQKQEGIVSKEEATQFLCMYMTALQGDKGSKNIIKSVISYDKTEMKGKGVIDKIKNRTTYKEFNRYATAHEELCSTIEEDSENKSLILKSKNKLMAIIESIKEKLGRNKRKNKEDEERANTRKSKREELCNLDDETKAKIREVEKNFGNSKDNKLKNLNRGNEKGNR